MQFRDFHRNIQLRFIAQFLITLSTTMIVPFLAIYFAKTIGEMLTGILYIVVIVSGIIGGLIGGHLSDQIGRKKLMVVSEVIIVLSFTCISIVNSPWLESPYTTIGLFIVNMFFMGLFSPAAEAMIIDVSSPSNRKYVYNFSYWLHNIAVAIGGVIGAFLFVSFRFELFLFTTITSLISLLITIFFITETYAPTKDNTQEMKQKHSILITYGKVLKDKTFMLYAFAGLLIVSIEQQLTNYIGIRLEQEVASETLFNIGTWKVEVDGVRILGFLKTENTILVVLFSGVMVLLMKKLRDSMTFHTGVLLYTIGYVVISFSTSPLILLIAMLVATIGELMYIPVKQAYLGNLAPDHARSSYMAINGLTYHLSMVIGAIFITVGSFLNYKIMSLLIFLMGILGMICFQRVMRLVELKQGTIEREVV